MCHEYEYDWYERARIAEQQRRERERRTEEKREPSKAPARPDPGVKQKDPVPA